MASFEKDLEQLITYRRKDTRAVDAVKKRVECREIWLVMDKVKYKGVKGGYHYV